MNAARAIRSNGMRASYDTVRRVSEPLVGETVDTRYELRRLIARGGMGLVFEAHHRFTRRAVALKLLPDDLRGKKEIRGRLLREAHALTAVRHPGFVEVLDAGVCGEHGPYLVLEMLDGRTLDGILAARRRLAIADTVQIGRQVCDAIAHANGRGVVHRDLKPSNLFIARNEIGEETLKLIDLGVAAVAEEQLEQHDRKLTQAHEVVGTPEYMAPEQLWGREVDARTDVYAIGMSLFECLTGEVPYLGTYPDVLVQVSNATEPPSVREKRPDVPPRSRSSSRLPSRRRPRRASRRRRSWGARSSRRAVSHRGARRCSHPPSRKGRRAVRSARRSRSRRSAPSTSSGRRHRAPTATAPACPTHRRRTGASTCVPPTSRRCSSCRPPAARSRRGARRSARKECWS